MPDGRVGVTLLCACLRKRDKEDLGIAVDSWLRLHEQNARLAREMEAAGRITTAPAKLFEDFARIARELAAKVEATPVCEEK